MKGQSFILMGVSGTGKTTIGLEVAHQLNLKFIDGDDLHPRSNIIKMKNKQPLNDEDRVPWLERINDAAFSLEQKSEAGIIICSALKKQYRDQIRAGNKNIYFIFLNGDFNLILKRMQNRKGHFMKEEILRSQFETLEIPGYNESGIITIDINGSVEKVVEHCISALKPLIYE